MNSADDPQRQGIIDTAARLFAAFGYDGTSLHGIAEAAGQDLAWVQQRLGDKHELYTAVVEYGSRMERAVVKDALGTLPPTDSEGVRVALHRFSERYLEFFLANPHIPALWAHRWLGDAADIPDLEERYATPTIALVHDALRSAAQAGLVDGQVDLELTVRTLIWSVYGFMHGEVMGDAHRSVSADLQARKRFLTHLNQLVDRMLKLSDA